jgi:DNA-binding NarL/FixJ family response regulator
MQGQAALSPEVTEPLLKAIVRSSTQAAQPELSERELEVVSCLAESLTTQQIAKKLFISENTVKTHIRHILEKLDVANRSEAVTRAYQLGIIAK